MSKSNIPHRGKYSNEYVKKLSVSDRSSSSVKTYRSTDLLEFTFQPKSIFKIIISIICCLVLLNLLGQTFKHLVNAHRGEDLIRLFSLDSEACIPSIYSSFALLLCSVLLAIVTKSKYRQRNRYRLHWKFLSIIFLYLAIDEGASIHEISTGLTLKVINTSGFLYFAWVIPASILLAIFTIVYWKFLFSLPKNTRYLFILAAVLFVVGAIGIEMIGGKIVSLQGTQNLTYALFATVEETLEMVGVAIFIYALLDYIQKHVKTFKVSL